MIRGEAIIFSGNANTPLAEEVCEYLGVPLAELEIGQFADGETTIKINQSVRGKEVYLIQPTSPPVNEHLMQTLILIDAFKRASAYKINLIMPYYGYARQDRKTRGREPITAKLVADLLTKAGADRVVTIDLHAGQIQGYFDIPVDHFSAETIFADYFRPMIDDSFTVVSPDLGGVTRSRSFANLLRLPIAIIEKRRPKPNVSEVMNIIGQIRGKNCILIDDIIDTAGTITNAANSLREYGARDVYICATHAVLSGNAIERIQNSVVSKCVITNTIRLPEDKQIDKIDVVSVAPILAEAIKRINTNEAISELF